MCLIGPYTYIYLLILPAYILWLPYILMLPSNLKKKNSNFIFEMRIHLKNYSIFKFLLGLNGKSKYGLTKKVIGFPSIEKFVFICMQNLAFGFRFRRYRQFDITTYRYNRQENKCYPQRIYLPISKLHSILDFANLLSRSEFF